ncbi:MAG: putative metal-binding motif-containing protein [Candidatus Woesearchaeota archaeon]
MEKGTTYRLLSLTIVLATIFVWNCAVGLALTTDFTTDFEDGAWSGWTDLYPSPGGIGTGDLYCDSSYSPAPPYGFLRAGSSVAVERSITTGDISRLELWVHPGTVSPHGMNRIYISNGQKSAEIRFGACVLSSNTSKSGNILASNPSLTSLTDTGVDYVCYEYSQASKWYKIIMDLNWKEGTYSAYLQDTSSSSQTTLFRGWTLEQRGGSPRIELRYARMLHGLDWMAYDNIKHSYEIVCEENWQCTEWSECGVDLQVRSCTDLNDCGTTENKPPDSQTCVPDCIPDYQCDYTACINGSRSGRCVDLNGCEEPWEEAEDCSSCIDVDKDGYGAGCARGLDCNDNDAAINPSATEGCDTKDNDCDGTVDEGCTCTEGETKQCGSSNIGVCKYGTQTCSGSSWGSCAGSVEPVEEVCDDSLDNDCDGTIDEGCEECVPEWECKVEPEQCPASGKQTKYCTDSRCGSNPKSEVISCKPITPDTSCNGCTHQGSCVFFGFREQNNYCDVNKKFSPQKNDSTVCSNNYECKSNVCSEGMCVNLQEEIAKSVSLLKKIWCKIIHFFSDDKYQLCLAG